MSACSSPLVVNDTRAGVAAVETDTCRRTWDKEQGEDTTRVAERWGDSRCQSPKGRSKQWQEQPLVVAKERVSGSRQVVYRIDEMSY